MKSDGFFDMVALVAAIPKWWIGIGLGAHSIGLLGTWLCSPHQKIPDMELLCEIVDLLWTLFPKWVPRSCILSAMPAQHCT